MMLACLLLLLAAPQSRDDGAGMAIEMRSVSAQVAALRLEMTAFRLEMKERQEAVEAVKTDLAGMREDSRRERASVAGPFLASPPVGSDSLGVAKGAVFAPRIEAESPRRRDTILLKVKRIEPGALRTVAEVEFPPDGVFAELPIDQSGALYLVEWSTTEGQVYNLVLRDGASGQPAATVPVKALQNQGRFVFVGYRVE